MNACFTIRENDASTPISPSPILLFPYSLAKSPLLPCTPAGFDFLSSIKLNASSPQRCSPSPWLTPSGILQERLGIPQRPLLTERWHINSYHKASPLSKHSVVELIEFVKKESELVRATL